MTVNIFSHRTSAASLGSRRMSGTLIDQSFPEAHAILREAIRCPGAVRTVATCSHGSIVGSFPSNKMRTGFAAESRVERDAFLIADVLERVLRFRSQAVQVRFLHQGRIRNAFPDIAVERVDGALELWECKSSTIMRAETEDRLAALRGALSGIGIVYRIVPQDWLRQEPRASNAGLIWRHADRTVSRDLQKAALQSIRSGAGTLGQVGRDLGCTMTSLLAMVGQGAVAADIHSLPLGPASRVRLPLPAASAGGF